LPPLDAPICARAIQDNLALRYDVLGIGNAIVM
jgi:hypothetical protein